MTNIDAKYFDWKSLPFSTTAMYKEAKDLGVLPCCPAVVVHPSGTQISKWNPLWNFNRSLEQPPLFNWSVVTFQLFLFQYDWKCSFRSSEREGTNLPGEMRAGTARPGVWWETCSCQQGCSIEAQERWNIHISSTACAQKTKRCFFFFFPVWLYSSVVSLCRV